MITQQNTQHPKVIVLGGMTEDFKDTNTYFEFELCDIIGESTFQRFMLDFQKVTQAKKKIMSFFFTFNLAASNMCFFW